MFSARGPVQGRARRVEFGRMAIALVRARSLDLKTATAVAAGFSDPPDDRRFFNQIPLQPQRGRRVQNARPRTAELPLELPLLNDLKDARRQLRAERVARLNICRDPDFGRNLNCRLTSPWDMSLRDRVTKHPFWR
jgi:hypothetical protein